MGLLQSISAFLSKHPGNVLIVGVGLVLSLFILTICIHPLPSFKDPLIGFEVRDTPIANKLNTWKILQDESSASANNLSLVPNSPRYDKSYYSPTSYRVENDRNTIENNSIIEPEPPIVEMSTQQVGRNFTNNNNPMLDEGEEDYYRSINSSKILSSSLMHYSLGSSKAFCGKLYDGYAQVVVTSSIGYSSQGLFNLNSMLATCEIDRRLRLEHSDVDSLIFQSDCEQYQEEHEGPHRGTCCNSWSLPNYIACLSNKTTCMDIDSVDMRRMEQLLNSCAPYYFRYPFEECFTKEDEVPSEPASTRSPLNILAPSTHELSRPFCGSIPEKCLRCDGWTYSVMHYLTNDNFLRDQSTDGNETVTFKQLTPTANKYDRQDKVNSQETIVNKLKFTNIFLPVAKSSSLMKYYNAISRYNLKTPFAQVKVLDLGMKNSLFEHLISDDMKLFMIALILILIVISIYTWSMIISLVILMIICLSLCLSYSIYELIFNIPIFPFMNLLAVVISFGICSDNAMLFCKHWTLERYGQNNDEDYNNQTNSPSPIDREQAKLDKMLKRAVISTSVATLATASSFIISAISQVTAVRCFCIFATLSVLTNYLLIVLLLPPALILDARFHQYLNELLLNKGPKLKLLLGYTQNLGDKLLDIGDTFHRKWIVFIVLKCRYYLIIGFVTLLVCSSLVVFHYPKLRPADEEHIQLLSRKHAFEQYDKDLRRQFAFERAKQGETSQPINGNFFQETPATLPIRVVFGVRPQDNGNHFDPHDRGTLKFDPRFDFTDANVQKWLLEFCQKLRSQRFIDPSAMGDMSNCFIDTFKSWMEARSCMDPVRPDVDRSPCCQSFEFPYTSYTLNRCMGEAISIMRKTPQYYPNVNGGIKFFKNSSKVAAVIVEFQSNRRFTESFTKMDKFYTDINRWVKWEVSKAPSGLRSGWFISSNLELLALQLELEQSTNTSIMIEILFAMMALVLSTRDLILTIAGTLTIGSIIIVTMALLILLNWTLGVAESILISLTIGLSIDFALHYTVAYSEGFRSRPNNGSISRILAEVGSPIALATITTSLAGFVIIWSDILAYQQLGTFLMLIAFVSWVTSTFFLLPMLSVVDLMADYGEQYARHALQRGLKFLIDQRF